LRSFSVLASSRVFEAKDDEQVRAEFEQLVAEVKKQQKDARSLALEIMRNIHQVSTKSRQAGDIAGIGAAIERYALADNQARELLAKETRPGKGPIADAVNQFRKSAGLI
jgi:methylthioribose-1-phosphate isomerase